MDEPVFLIRQKKYVGGTRNEIISMSLEFALNHMKITASDKE